jgi:hypothetical protein
LISLLGLNRAIQGIADMHDVECLRTNE